MLLALEEQLAPVEMVVVRGEGKALAAWQAALEGTYAPTRIAVAIPADAQGLPQALASKRAMPYTVAYVCRGSTCSAPVDSLAVLTRQP